MTKLKLNVQAVQLSFLFAVVCNIKHDWAESMSWFSYLDS